MEPLNHHTLLIFSIFFLITFNSANAICVPINGTKPTTSPSPSPYASPISQPVAAPESVPFHLPALNQKPKLLFPIFPSLMEAVPQSLHTDPSLKKICAATDFPEVCISSIAPLLNGKTDPISVVELAIKAATEHTQVAVATATKIATSPGIAPDIASTISDCKDSYDDALDNFQKALDALSSRDVGTMNSMLSAAITDFSDNDDFLAGKASSPVLLEFNAKLSKMTSNCLAIVSLIK
ncbi:hypothetical protein RHSIM_Rhsim02G0004500 [Rhododendron simsii]|uniref:Pectinesterase inhibitor domain-containing protein n=1 Tax=Rhododendron simsii TaxID=118357 RepID=A0A834LUM1_RHOSS|nr:hypothetical protein RHSIM_Rhsim02G0004500 [Rhododendron simsii]